MAAAWNDVPATGGLSECAALVRSAEALRTSAPELSVQLARRALLVGATDLSATNVHAGEGRALAMRAQAVLASGLVRISQHVGAVEPGFAALALAESGGALVLATELRLDLAACAQEVGEPLLGGVLLRPVLEATHAPPSVRAAALSRLVGCVAHVARRDDVEDALAEADRLLAADDGMNSDARRMERARLAVRTAAYHRWYGDNEEAVTAARDGLALLGRLRRELRAESDRLHARLVLEMVCALLDEGELLEAENAARPTVDEPVRATSAESVCQLMLAVATRVHLPAGEMDRGRGLVDQAAWLAERHGLDSTLADALTEASRLDEQIGRTKEALESMRAARAAEQRRMRAVARAARHLLVQVGAGQGVKDVTQQSVAALLRQLAHPTGVPVSVAPPPAPTQRSTLPPPRTSTEPHAQPAAGELAGSVDERTGLLNREGLFRRLRSVRTGERPVALTLVRFQPNKDNPDEDQGPDTGIMVGLADKVRDIAPENAELARSDGGELAVFLPHTTRDQAEEFAATIRETATRSDWLADGSGKDLSISTSVVQSDAPTADPDTQMDATGMLTAARDALTPARNTPTPAGPASVLAGDTPTSVGDASALAGDASTPIGNASAFAWGASAPARDVPTPAGDALSPTQTADVPPTQAADLPPTQAAMGFDTFEETKAALAALSEQQRARHVDRPADEAPSRPRTALEDEPPTTPLHVARPGDPAATAGRSILNSLSIPSGSGGRRRAGGEPAPGERPTRPTEPAQAPRLTQPDQGPQDPPGTPYVAKGWPAEPDVSQPLRRTPAETRRPTGEVSPAGEASPAGAHPTSGVHSTGGSIQSAGGGAEPTSNHLAGESIALTSGAATAGDASAALPSGLPPAPEAPAAVAELPPPSVGVHPADRASSYEETRAELARMMSALNANALRSRTKSGDTSASPEISTSDPREILVPRQSIPTPPEPEEMPEPPGRPDIPEPPRRPDIPEPPEPDPIPRFEPEPGPTFPDEPGEPRSRLMAAFDALTGPFVPSSPPEDDPKGEQFRTNFDGGTGLPSRKPLKSWAELESASVVDSPADNLFGAPTEKTSRSSLGAAFGGGEPATDGPPEGPARPAEPSWNEYPAANERATANEYLTANERPSANEHSAVSERSAANEHSMLNERSAPGERSAANEHSTLNERSALSERSTLNERSTVNERSTAPDNRRAVDEPRRRSSTSAELRAALWGHGTDEPYELPSVVPGEWIIGPASTVNEVSATFDEWSAAAPAVGSEPSGAGRVPSGASAGLHTEPTPNAPADVPTPAADTAPDDKTTPLTRASDEPTYDEPIGPQPRPEGLPRRGERSATTIASLLTEALAAYQSTTDDEDEPHRGPERFDWDPTTNYGRHRSPE